MTSALARAKGRSAANNGNQAQTLNDFLGKYKKQIELALPKHLTADRMIRLALTSFSQNKALQRCDVQSIFSSVVIASQLGLEIGVTGQGFLVPYGKQNPKCQFIPGWQGLVDLVSRSGRGSVWTGAIYEGDDFDFALGSNPFINHRPEGEDDPEALLYTYAVGRVNGSDWPIIEIWPSSKIWKHRDKYNKVGTNHYSYENQEMYARKVALLQVLK